MSFLLSITKSLLPLLHSSILIISKKLIEASEILSKLVSRDLMSNSRQCITGIIVYVQSNAHFIFEKMSSNVDISYISCGCNRNPHSVDWSRSGLICFASCNSIVIYDPTIGGEGGKITHTLHAHKKRVNCVRWLKNNTNTPGNAFISVSTDETAILWSWDTKLKTYAPESTLTGHKNIITVADGLVRNLTKCEYARSQSPVLLGTSSIDSNVMVWERDNEEVKCVDTINWNSGFCLDVKFSLLPHTDIAILACAADDSKVHLFAEYKKSEITKADPEHKFYKIHVLSGHEDWVRAMDFMCDENNNLFLATGSQDTHIRVYKFQKKSENKSGHTKLTRSSNLKGILEPEEDIIKVSSTCSEHHFAVALETVLTGHEGWIYGVCWHPPVYSPSNESSHGQNMEISGGFKSQKVKLLSSSIDKTIIVWSPGQSGLWSEEARVGEVGGNMLGFYGGKFGANGQSILGHGYLGSFHIWSYDQESKNWEPQVVVGGHTAGVMDLTWDLEGNYIVSVGSDQTTRVHAPWVRKDSKKITWHEIGRPQIHGYDLNCVAMLSEYKFASGAEEKVIRAFTAPNNFVENFKRISDVKIDANEVKGEGLPQGASVPALGLSNKPVFEQMKKEGFIVDDDYPDLYFSPIYLKKPPTEENLMQNTLWPEAQKLYGHGYEVYSLAARRDGVVLASSCKATTAEHAAIILWNAKTWLQIQKLVAHQLTVTQMSFSPNGEFLVSVSRDRRWALFGVNEDGKTYRQVASANAKDSLHTRVIWCCCWTSDSSTFATGSRDGKIGFWSPSQSAGAEVSVKQLAHLEFAKESVRALAFAPVLRRNFHILAVGLENGSIFLYRYLNSVAENLWVVFEGNMGHSLAVKKLAFRPKVGCAGVKDEENEDNSNVLQLVSCGSDHIIKVYDLRLNQL